MSSLIVIEVLSGYPKRRFYLIVSLLLLFAGSLYFNNVKRVGFATGDERWLNLAATDVRAHGISRAFIHSERWSKAQGRIGYRIMVLPIVGLYLVDPDVRPELITFVQILAYATIALFLSFYLGGPAGLLVLAFLLCFLTHPGYHYPDAANPLVFHLELALFFAGFALQRSARRSARFSKRHFVLTALACALVFFGVAFYESVFVVCFLAECAIVYSLAVESGISGRRAALLKAAGLEAPILGTLFLSAIVYVVFRVFHPSAYDGNNVGGSFHLGAISKSVVIYGIGGLPGVNWFLGLGPSFLSSELAQGISVPAFLIHHLGWSESILGLGIATTVWLFVQHWATWATDGHSILFWRRRGVLVASVALFVAIAAQIPMALSPKYNRNPLGVAPHVSSLFGFVGFCIGVPALLIAISVSAGKFRPIAATALALASFSLCVASREVSLLVVAAQERDYASSKIVDVFIKSKAFAAIPDNSLLVAPSLWDTQSLDIKSDAEYWEQYINLRAGRNLRVQRLLPDRSKIPDAPGGVYYVEHQRAVGGTRLLISQLYKQPGGDGLVSDTLTVLSPVAMEEEAVVFQQPSEASALHGAGLGILVGEPLRSRYDGSVFFAKIAVPDGFIPGTAYVVSRDAAIGIRKLNALGQGQYEPSKYPLSGKVRTEFGDGFFPLEQTDKHYWHWSSGPSGTAEVALWNETAAPLKILFEGCIATGFAPPSKAVMRMGGQSAELTSNNACSPFSQPWTLAPGRNILSIHSDAARLPTPPGEQRYMVFGLYDWKVRDPNAFLPSPAELSDTLNYPLSGKVRIEFGSGFFAAEHSPDHYWHWSNGPSGSGEVIFWNRTDQRLNAVFTGCVTTGFPQPSRLVLDFNGSREVFSANNTCAPLKREWTLAPGKNTVTIHSDAGRLVAPAGDARYMVFGLFDWKLSSKH